VNRPEHGDHTLTGRRHVLEERLGLETGQHDGKRDDGVIECEIVGLRLSG
jgi:hypothetical protein